MFLISTKVAASEIHGSGCFTEHKIKAGTVVWRFHPKVDVGFSGAQVLAMPPAFQAFLARYASKEFGEDRYTLCTDDARFLNHSNTPNLMHKADTIVAKRDIAAGEELTLNYRFVDDPNEAGNVLSQIALGESDKFDPPIPVVKLGPSAESSLSWVDSRCDVFLSTAPIVSGDKDGFDWRNAGQPAIRLAKARRWLALVFHWLMRPFGDLEATDVYKIVLRDLPPLFTVERYEIRKATAEDIEEIASNIIRNEPSAVVRDLWARGHHCFVAKYSGAVVAYNWIAFTQVQEEEYRYTPQPDHAICLDAYTVPEHRGKGLHLLLLLTMLHFAAAVGKSAAYTGVSLLNSLSWKAHLRIGWVRYFTFVWFRPYFTFSRRPWRLTSEQYPLKLDWANQAWLVGQKRAG